SSGRGRLPHTTRIQVTREQSQDGQPRSRPRTGAGHARQAGAPCRRSGSVRSAVREPAPQQRRYRGFAGWWAQTPGRWRKARPSGSFLATSATSGRLAWYTLKPIRSAVFVTRSGLASTNLAPRGFCCSSKPSTISGVAGAWAVEDLLTESFAAVAFTMDLRDLLFRFVIWVLLKSRRAPKRGPVAKVDG